MRLYPTDRFFLGLFVLVFIIEFTFPQVTYAGAKPSHRYARERILLAQAIAESPVGEFLATFAAPKSEPARNSTYVTVTAYSSTIDQTDDTPYITAAGTFVRDGVIAANFLPIGTRLRMPDYFGDKVFIVEDRMNERYWYRIDIWMPERALAKEWGVKRVRVELL